jgi:DNA-binding SARP family transcriptional activator
MGVVALDGGHRIVAVPSGKPGCVLAILALHPNRTISLDDLTHRVWGQEQPASARNALYVYVCQLRLLLSRHARDVVLLKEPSGYRLKARPEQVDVLLMRDLSRRARAAMEAGRPGLAADLSRQGLTLWYDRPLASISGDWAEHTRTELDRQRLSLTMTGFNAALALGQHESIIDDLYDTVADFPLTETLVEQLMLALYRSGRVAEALTAFAEAHARYRDELAARPGRRLVELHQHMLRCDPALLVPDGEADEITRLRQRISELEGRMHRVL